MKAQILTELQKAYTTVHGCYRPPGGPCFYLASNATTADYGRRRGRVFVAAQEGTDGTPETIVVLRFLVGQMALLAKGDLIVELDIFCREVGLARLRDSLDQDYDTQREEEIVLTRESDDSEFLRPDASEVIRRYQALRNEILVVLATHHAKGAKRVPKPILLNDLCDDMRQIDRALNELVELRLLRDLNHSNGMQLTAEGQKSTETSLAVGHERHERRKGHRFDFFLSYASEDRDLAQAIDAALSERGYHVWRDRGQLTLGDSLTEKINEGLAASRYGLVILSEAFLKKNWPRAELNALQARAIAEGGKVILPVRWGLGHEEMAKHFPLLGDKLTVSFDDNMDELITEIERAVGASS